MPGRFRKCEMLFRILARQVFALNKHRVTKWFCLRSEAYVPGSMAFETTAELVHGMMKTGTVESCVR